MFASKRRSWLKVPPSAFKWVWELWNAGTQEERTLFSASVGWWYLVSAYRFSVWFLLFLFQEKARRGVMSSHAALKPVSQFTASLRKSYGHPRFVGDRWQIICRNGRRGGTLLLCLEEDVQPGNRTVHLLLCGTSSRAGWEIKWRWCGKLRSATWECLWPWFIVIVS